MDAGTTMTQLVFDFEADIRSEYAGKLAALGIPVAAGDKAEDLIVRFFCVSDRQIKPAARTVVWSSELRARATQLSTTYQQALAAIERASLSGADLNPYQSRDLAKKPWKPDPQLLEWGVAHFHLGVGRDAKYPDMIAGSPDLLFVVVQPDAVYFVDVLPHASFTDQAVFDTACRNWPELFAHAACDDRVVGLEYNCTAEERKKLRGASINVLTMGETGRVYAPVGGGTTTSGAPVHIVKDHVFARMGPLRAWQRLCETTPSMVLAMIPEVARTDLGTIELHASETPEGTLAFTATNLVDGPHILGTGYPPKA